MVGTDRNRIRVAFIGLGTMGRPMAAALLRAGHQVCVVPHRDPAAGIWLAQCGADVAETPAAAAAGASLVITMLPGPAQVEEVLFGPDGVVQRAAGCVVVDMSTVPPAFARATADRLKGHGIAFLDAPVSGGPVRATDGTLTIIVGGDERDLARARPILVDLGRLIFHAGPVGAGQIAKACNNLLVAANMLANAEALAMGVAAGMSAGALHEILLACTGSNWQLENIVPRTILRQDYTPIFALNLLRKDLGIAEQIAADSGIPSVVGDLARQMYGQAAAAFGDGNDFSSVARLYGNDTTDHAPPAHGSTDNP
jgi:3-hydroxyisobutyrate dehydrogenase